MERIKSLCAVSLAGLMSAGCVTTEPEYSRVETYGPPAQYAGVYTGADRLYRNNYVANTRPSSSQHAAPMSEARVLAAYEGVDGARLAHRLYGEAQAERLDGACERFVKIENGETLYDIAQYCDVPVSMLVGLNPVIGNPRHVQVGQIVEVPQIYNADRHALAAGAGGEAGVVFASWYVVQPGDTLNAIAAKHLVSASSVANLNPGLSWSAIPVGAQIRLPAVGAAEGSPQPAAISGSLPYPYGPASAYAPAPAGQAGGAIVTGDVGLMPYQMTPAQKAAEAASGIAPRLSVDRDVIDRGDSVFVSAGGLPANSTVSLYRGANGREMRFVKTVRTDASGNFNEEVRVRRGADLGGVIFRAVVDETGERLQSQRVGVNDFGAALSSSYDEDM